MMVDFTTLINEIFRMDCSDYIFAMSRQGESWKRQRKLFTRHLTPSAITQVFSSQQITSVHTLLRQILFDSVGIRNHLFHAAASVILGISYGYDVQVENDPFMLLSVDVAARLLEAFTPKYLVNSFPICESRFSSKQMSMLRR